jgi:hypothetical protein
MMFKESTLYEWLSDYDSFSYEFKRFVFQITQAFGLLCRFDENTLKLVHEKWNEDCEIWRTQHFDGEADALSHIKLSALLLHHLSASPYISGLFKHDYTSDLHYQFSGTTEQLEEAKQDVVSAREAIFSLDFCISVICWYEERRIDRIEPHIFRMTPDLRHDIISYLVSRNTDQKAIYLILKALFIRTHKKAV